MKVYLHVGITSGEDAGHQESIGEVRKNADTEILHSNNVRTRGSSPGLGRAAVEDAVERGIVIRDDDSAGKGATDEENPKSEIDRFERALKISAWV